METRSTPRTLNSGKWADSIHERHGDNVSGKTTGQGKTLSYPAATQGILKHTSPESSPNRQRVRIKCVLEYKYLEWSHNGIGAAC